MKKIIFTLLIFLIFIPLKAKDLNINYDFSVFHGDSAYNILEVYFSYPDTSMTYVFNKNKFDGDLSFNLKINDGYYQIKDLSWISGFSAQQPVTVYKMDLIGQKSIQIIKKPLLCKLTVFDKNDTLTKIYREFVVRPLNYKDSALNMSDIEICSSIEDYNSGNQYQNNESFIKGNKYIIPNPSNIIFGESQSLKIYFETYKAKTFKPGGYNINYRITDAIRNLVLNYNNKCNSNSDAIPETIDIPLDALKSGIYYLKVTVSDINNPSDTISRLKKFYLLNPSIHAVQSDNFAENAVFDQSEFATYDELTALKEFEKASIIATENEKDLFMQCTTVEAKQHFLFAFWKKRNTDTSQTFNVRLMKYRELIDYSDHHFSYGMQTEGWKTDRGKVTLKYGMPSSVERIPADGDQRPYEKWHFDAIQGGAEFDFVDFWGYGDYRLVNSTAYGEVKNVNWFDDNVIMNNQNSKTYSPTGQ